MPNTRTNTDTVLIERALIKRPTVGRLATDRNFDNQPLQAGDTTPHWNGVEVVYYTVTAEDVKRVARYLAREPQRRAALLARIAEADRQAERRYHQARVARDAARLNTARSGLALVAAASR